MSSSESRKQDSARSPFAGCAILIAAFAVMVFLIGFSILTLFRQFNEIAKFTGEKPVPIAVSSIENQEDRLTNLAQRLETFRQQLASNTETSLSLSADDLNLAIATYDAFKELRGTLHVESIGDETLRLAISFPLNGRPRFTHEGESGWIASDQRFLNGVMVARPNLLKREVILSIDTIEVPDKKVAPEFIDQMSPYRIAERYLNDPVIGPAMAKLTRVGVSDAKLVLTRNPKETPVDFITNAEVDSASNRFFKSLGIGAACFLAFAGIVVFLGLRAKARTARND